VGDDIVAAAITLTESFMSIDVESDVNGDSVGCEVVAGFGVGITSAWR
jgi:hypothetical protein